MNKYWKKLCTTEENQRQTSALMVLAVSLSVIFVIWLIAGQ
jgi:hypothetical protein